MDNATFQRLALRYWDTYFSQTLMGPIQSRLSFAGAMYPAGIVFGEFKNHYSMELVGCRPGYDGLTPWKTSSDSIESYLGQFQDVAYVDAKGSAIMVVDGASDILLNNLVLISAAFQAEFERRFPHLARHLSSERSIITRDGDADGGPPIAFAGDFSNVRFQEAYMINGYRGTVRVRHILMLAIFSKEVTPKILSKIFREAYPSGSGVVCGLLKPSDARNARAAVASQFLSRILTPGTEEIAIGDFLKSHDEILRGAFGYQKIVYEPYFPWMPGTHSDGETAINPDLMGQRADGKWDILDLKLPLLRVNDVTAGPRPRRRFKMSIAEGLEQLAHYEYYFSFPANRAEAWRRHSIAVDNPQKILIVGTSENVIMERVEQALRSRAQSLNIFDYDTVTSLYLNSPE